VGLLHALKIRILQTLALFLPGGSGLRVRLHRWRGVRIGGGVFISTDVIIETMRPELVSIGDDVFLGVRTTVMAHFNDVTPDLLSGSGHSVTIADQVYIGPGSIILPGVTIGRGAVVTAGSVVSGNVRELTMVQGNPARPVAMCGIPLGPNASAVEFYRQLKPLRA
jgi:acetyltransferase-like isoleucine patch superfamily enzyme